MARSAAHGRAEPRKAAVRASKQAPPTAAAPAAATSLPALPADAAEILPGQLYAGRLPPPGPVPPPMPAAAGAAPVADAAARQDALGWSDVGHYVASDLSPEHSVLLMRGSDAAEPRWVDCGSKPAAVLAAVATVLAPAREGARVVDPAASSWIDALRTLGAKTVLIATDPDEASAAQAAFDKAGLPALAEGDTLMLASSAAQGPAIRAGVGARYCVVALVGRSAADFPNGLSPAATPPALSALWGHGWFLLPERAK